MLRRTSASVLWLKKELSATQRDPSSLSSATSSNEFKSYDYKAFYKVMVKPAFIFDGRNILDHSDLMAFGFEVNCIGKALGKNTAQTPVSVNYR
jgi:hypothetical protein